MRHSLSVLLAALVGLAVALPSHAAPDKVDAPDLAVIRAEQLELRALAAAGEDPFDTMGTAERQALVDRQTRLLKLLEGRESFDELMAARQVEIANLLQEINSMVNVVSDDEKFRCEYIRTTGSNRKQRVCKSVAERRIQSEASREAMRRWQSKGHFHPDVRGPEIRL
jgi:hypothetical protein